MFKKILKNFKVIYLDHAATTPLDPSVESAMRRFLREKFGNPSSIYALGMEANMAIDGARKDISEVLNCRPNEIIFTAGGTESANFAIFGIVRPHLARGKRKPHVITTTIEHHAVLEPLRALQREGLQVTYLPVDAEGFVDPKAVTKAIKPNTILVSVMYANNEIGTVQPISQIAAVLRKENQARVSKNKQQIIFHSDACQAAGALPLNVNKLGVDLLTINASKIYGPKQVGLLYIRSGTKIAPLIYGGGQELGLRSGTENVSGIVGFAKALQIAEKFRVKEVERQSVLRNSFLKKVLKAVPKIILNGPDLLKKIHPKARKEILRLPNNLNLCVLGVEGETLLLYLDAAGIIVSTGSACSSTSIDPSHVLLAIGRSKSQAQSSIRLTLGRSTTKKQLDYVLKILPKLVQELRRVKSHILV